MTDFDAEWAGMQAAAREQVAQQQAAGGARTRLNTTGGGGGSGGAGVDHDEEGLQDVETHAIELGDTLSTHGQMAENSTHVAGVLLRTPGLETGPALIELVERWGTQSEALRDACLTISGHMRETIQRMADVELDIIGGLNAAGMSPHRPQAR
ncbi:hypothetical protein [Streptomyces avicenniae]|uniref:hypothetical protein n=1 Tax=Streptomyces avicenniae TaxID=500153 RepID=UPI00069C9665|nr:hypothetical protein [Streptomyces avicenniae]